MAPNPTGRKTPSGSDKETADRDVPLSVYARRELFRRVGEVLWRFRRRVAVALVLLVTAKLFAVLVPVALKRIVDTLEAGNEVLVLPVFLLLAYALLRFFSGVFTELRDIVFARVTQTAVAEFTVRMFSHLHSLGVKHLGGRQTGVFSGYGEQRSRLRALLAGFQIHIAKPVDARELLASLEAIVRRKN